MSNSVARFGVLLDEFRDKHDQFVSTGFVCFAGRDVEHMKERSPIGDELEELGSIHPPVLDPSKLFHEPFFDEPVKTPEHVLRQTAQIWVMRSLRWSVSICAPATGRYKEAFRSFRSLADKAGREIPICVRDMVPLHVEPTSYVDRWLELLFWLSPPDGRFLSHLLLPKFSWFFPEDPFRESADAIERCCMHTDQPKFQPTKWPIWAGSLPEIKDATVAVESDTKSLPSGKKSTGSNNAPRRRRGDKIRKALQILPLHPDWTDKRIAEEVGCTPSNLSGNPTWRAAREVIRQKAKTPMTKSKNARTNETEFSLQHRISN